MFGQVGRLGSLGARRRLTLLGSSNLSPAFTFSRSQPSSAQSTALGSDGLTWAAYAANILRLNGTAQSPLFEGSRTNSARNPRAEGAAAGTPGTAPTHWGSTTTGRTIHGTAVVQGLTLLDLSYTVASADNRQLLFDTNTIAAASGEVWSCSMPVNLQSGLVTASISLIFRNGGGTLVGSATSSTVSTLGTPTRMTVSGTAPATTASVTPQINIFFSAATTARLQYGAPQIELGAFTSTPVLPVANTPAISTRGADLASAPLTTTLPGGAGYILFKGTIPQNASSSADQLLFQLDDGSDSNVIRVRNVAGGATLVAGAVVAGVPTDATSLGSMTAGTEFKLALSVASGRIAGLLSGGTVRASTTLPSGLTTFRLGSNAVGTANLFGQIRTVQTGAWVPSDADLAALLAAF